MPWSETRTNQQMVQIARTYRYCMQESGREIIHIDSHVDLKSLPVASDTHASTRASYGGPDPEVHAEGRQSHFAC